MKHVRCYACNKLGHISKECRRISGTITKAENIITLEDMEKEGSIVRKMWHGTVYRHNTLTGS